MFGWLCSTEHPALLCCALPAPLPPPQTTAAQLSALVLAAHQPLWSLWSLVSFTNTPLESAALAFLPVTADDSQERRDTARLLMQLGMASGVVGSFVAAGLPAVAPHLFTSNSALWVHMRTVGPQGALAMLFCGIDVAATGCLLAIKDSAFVVSAASG
jgi:Na+-driven multidrug efflux pump